MPTAYIHSPPPPRSAPPPGPRSSGAGTSQSIAQPCIRCGGIVAWVLIRFRDLSNDSSDGVSALLRPSCASRVLASDAAGFLRRGVWPAVASIEGCCALRIRGYAIRNVQRPGRGRARLEEAVQDVVWGSAGFVGAAPRGHQSTNPCPRTIHTFWLCSSSHTPPQTLFKMGHGPDGNPLRITYESVHVRVARAA